MAEKIHCKEDFDSLLHSADSKLVVAQFHAKSCGHCKSIGASLNEMSHQYRNVKFASIDIDEVQDLDACSRIKATPTFHFYRNERKIREYVGSSEHNVRKQIEELM